MNTEPFDAKSALLSAFSTNHRINLYLIREIPDEAWQLARPDGKGRTIANIFAHLHNVRVMWLDAIAKGSALPEKLDGAVSKDEVIAALETSGKAITDVLQAALAGDGRVKGFKPDAVSFIAYLVAHDAHHRGQVALLAKQSGHPLPKKALYGIWEWGVR